MVRERLRMVAKQSARSVTEMAPRASSTLNTELSRSRLSYAGTGSCAHHSFSWVPSKPKLGQMLSFMLVFN